MGLSDIDFISIDTEGTELDVLMGLDLECKNYRISMLVVENNHDEDTYEKYLNKFGWQKIERHFVNDFYVRKPTWWK